MVRLYPSLPRERWNAFFFLECGMSVAAWL